MNIFDNRSVLPGVGDTVWVDHVCIQVASGMMIAAKTFFVKLGYTEATYRRISADWGDSCLMVKRGSIDIQLIESSDPTEVPAGENHVAIAVADPEQVVHAAISYLRWAGLDGTQEQVGEENKFFLYVPKILIQPLEFVQVLLV